MRLTLVMLAPEQVQQLARDEKALVKIIVEAKAGSGLHMDKEWHGIHYLLTGDPWSTKGPYGQVILGGKEIGPDLGYGPARVLSTSQVAEIASTLKSLSEEQLRKRYDPAAMTKAEIYPEMIWQREGEAALVWLLEGYRKLVDFYAKAAAQGKVVLLAIV
ncbi:MAG: YfbM family protein [Pseudomonadota bacterium]